MTVPSSTAEAQAPAEPQRIHRSAYTEPAFWIDRVDLFFDLRETGATVRARMDVRRNPALGAKEPLVLRGEELELRRVRVDAQERDVAGLERTAETLTLTDLPERFELETEVEIHPEANTKLMGLYRSSGNFATQCEAEGFRRITYFLDRPDVMARYRVRIEADRESCPVLLSNGNRVASGDLDGGRHWVEWEDPFPKPCYLFALVAGNLTSYRGDFTTSSGRRIELEVWVEPQNGDKCEHALRSLQKAMKWDEEVFGLEYDLDLYMIVAVSDFNMGAMENKGLNIFNSKYVLARPDTATDDDYEGIEGVVAHEYFHNWTGNRVTCRDWFQLTLKEGLTVFRDQEFSADMTSAAVKRIQDVRYLRTAQFAEDAGPMAHPIRPESYIEMNNFYTVTVYEKGSEVVRLYHTLLGPEGFRRGLDLYFERHDGEAVTCDDFRAAMADANGVDLSAFERWYSQAGTPVLRARGRYDAAARTYTLELRQSAPVGATDGGARSEEWLPVPIPVRVGLIDPQGQDLPLVLESDAPQDPGGSIVATRVLTLDRSEARFVFRDVPAEPVPSLLRGFSAPVKLEVERTRAKLAFLMAHDSDAFNRWDAGQELAKCILLDLVAMVRRGEELSLDPSFVEAFRSVLSDPKLDGSLKSLALTLPEERLLGQEMDVVDPDAIHAARSFVCRELARALSSEFFAAYEANRPVASDQHTLDKESIARRRMQAVVLDYLVPSGEPEAVALALRQFEGASNMTDYETAFSALQAIEASEREHATAAFYERWKHEPLVLDKWFKLQALSTAPGNFERVVALSEHADFKLENPNRARSLLGAFAADNPFHFHRSDGAGYAFLADKVLAIDALNPQVASRLVSNFNSWKRFDERRRALMQAQLERIAGHDGLSKDVTEIVGKALAE